MYCALCKYYQRIEENNLQTFCIKYEIIFILLDFFEKWNRIIDLFTNGRICDITSEDNFCTKEKLQQFYYIWHFLKLFVAPIYDPGGI